MKVCYVTHLPNLTGASQSLLDLLEALKGTEVEPVVLLNRHGPLEDELSRRDIPFQVIRFANELKKDNSTLHSLRKDALNVLAKRNIKDFLKAQSVELVHNNSMFTGIGMQAALELGIPYIAHVRDYVEEDHGLKLEHPKAQSRRVRNADAAIAVSKALATVTEKKYGAPKGGVTPLYDAVDVNRYLIPFEERNLPLQNASVELLLAGRIQPGKGQLDAVKAVAKLNETGDKTFHLTLVGSVGDPDYMSEVEAFVKTLPEGTITILPFVDDLKTLRKQTDIALVCSSSEAMGRVTIESLLSGCLVVGANGGATPELLAGGRGVLYEPGDIDGLANAILELTKGSPRNTETTIKMGQTYAQNTFNLPNYAEEILRLYKEILT